MNENFKQLWDKVGRDKELQLKLSRSRTLEEAYKLASSIQGGFTKEEFQAEVNRLNEEQMGDLSDEDLDKIAGGVNRYQGDKMSLDMLPNSFNFSKGRIPW